ncbi:MAG: exosortase/archaeosortase family protein [Candidatus Nanohaloarchaea archaeon]|nr:exosortase/archaeosortase family protein [Candidatus Nanohaloarchaea archaeon]
MAGVVPAAVNAELDRARERYRSFEERLDPRQRRLLHAFLFLARFTALAAPFYLVLGSGWDATGVRAATADVAAALLRAAGIGASSTGTFVAAGELLVDVTRDSTGWKSVSVFTALVLASRRPLRTRLWGIAAGAAALLAVNVLRIWSMVYAVTVFGVGYELLHTLLWRWGLTASVIAAWLLWMDFSAESPRFARWPGR